ncbi:MAG: hypothetical protein KKB81_02405 [Candidatus Margulisbacteria bacterium]|nr:hypothetical protein [Candidatus Margulisiibacteriota bacterium]MBU1021043.1 hypothetical protein [Candidatus Margulisiibacteriota bacterium]MBU1729718.1 hypothetical protein [Candidatus Margulisiibacteriota bacterium]MBU1955983.1 hypothetical protein [Candidatus Margulisiibacteriota bacterium]
MVGPVSGGSGSSYPRGVNDAFLQSGIHYHPREELNNIPDSYKTAAMELKTALENSHGPGTILVAVNVEDGEIRIDAHLRGSTVSAEDVAAAETIAQENFGGQVVEEKADHLTLMKKKGKISARFDVINFGGRDARPFVPEEIKESALELLNAIKMNHPGEPVMVSLLPSDKGTDYQIIAGVFEGLNSNDLAAAESIASQFGTSVIQTNPGRIEIDTNIEVVR